MAKRDIGLEILDGLKTIKQGQGKRTTVKKLRALLDRDLDLLRKMEKIRRVYDT